MPTPADRGPGDNPNSSSDEDKFRTIFDSVTDGILIFDRSGRILEVNRVLCDRLGYTREQLRRMTVAEIDSEASAALFRDRLELVIRQGFATYEVEHVRRDGALMPLEVGSRSIEFDGRPAILSVQRDIRERRAAEAFAREQQVYIQELVEAIPIPIISKDRDGRIRECNSAFLSSWGLSRTGVIGETIAGLGFPNAGRFHELDLQVIETGDVIQNEAWVPGATGTRRMIMTRSPLRMTDGVVAGTVTTALDITERYIAEQAMRQSEERFRTLFESASDSIFIIDRQGGFLAVNQSMAARLGYSKAELERMNLAEIVPQEDVPTLPQLIDRVFVQGSAASEASHIRKDGTSIAVELMVTRMQLDGDPVLLNIARDVTERKRAEADRILLESQLRQAQKMEGIGRLASGIAHDFNNLLTAIGGFAGLAMTGLPAHDERRRDIEQIQQAAGRAATLVRQLLDFSRASTRVEPAMVDVGDLLGRMDRMLGRLISEDISLSIDGSDCRASVMADAGQLEQVIVNLAVNAKDAMRHGGRLTIAAADVDVSEELAMEIGGTPGRNVRISVADSGTGMDETTMSHLFEPFFTTKEPGEGTGLGLAMVYGIVRNWSGGLRVRSELGKGSTFEVYLPVAEGAAQAGGSREDRTIQQSVGSGKRVLVVEDDEPVRHFAVRILERFGYDVTATDEALEAVERGVEGGFDLLLTDLVMPSMQGDQVAAMVRTANPGIHVVYMSGYGERSIDDPCDHVGYLPKPFSAEDLLTVVQRVFADGRVGHPSS